MTVTTSNLITDIAHERRTFTDVLALIDAAVADEVDLQARHKLAENITLYLDGRKVGQPRTTPPTEGPHASFAKEYSL